MIEINSDNNNIITLSSKVFLKSSITIHGTDTKIDIEHVADFSEIPTEIPSTIYRNIIIKRRINITAM